MTREQAAAVDTWIWQEWTEAGEQLGWVKSGHCPRCGHVMAAYQRWARPLGELVVTARCNCDLDHPGRPPGTDKGCGAWSRINPQGSENAPLPDDTPEPLDQPEWDKAATEIAISQLTTIRSTAEKWAGTVATLLGVFSSVAVLTGVDSLDKIADEGTRSLLFWGIVFAAVLAAASIGFASAAATSRHRKYRNWDGNALRAYVADGSGKALRALWFSQGTGVAAAALVTVIAAVALYQAVPEPTTKAPTALVVFNDGSVKCGPLTSADDRSAKVGGVPITGVERVDVVASC